MMVTRRAVLKSMASAGLAAGLGGTTLGACSSGGGGKRLQFWAFTETRIAWQKRAFELYKRERQPDFEIDWLILPYAQMHDKLLITAQSGSGGPDIVDVEISQFARYIKGDVLFVDMKPKLIEMGEWDNLFQSSAVDPWTWDGSVYGIGNELNACLLSYRWDLWQEAGLKEDLESFDEFIEQAKIFHDRTGNYLIDQTYTGWDQWWVLSLQQGGGFFDAEGQPTLNAAPGVNTLTYQQTALAEGWSVRRAIGPAFFSALTEGRVASLLGPSWLFSGFVRENAPSTAGQWRLMPIPPWTPGGARTATWGGTGVSVSRLSPYVEEALDFVLWEHTNTDAVMEDFVERQVWPTYGPAFEDDRLTEPLEFFDNQRVGDLIQEVSPEIPPAYTSPFWPETTDACVRVALTPALQNTGLSPQTALDNAQAETLDIIDFQTA